MPDFPQARQSSSGRQRVAMQGCIGLEIIPGDLKGGAMTAGEEGRPRAFELRGELVMLAPDIAAAFGAETRQVVQNTKNNPAKLSARYAFELTAEEADSLRSLGMISNVGRGGSRALPWVLTQKGVVRLATIMETPRALDATDLVIDVFSEVMSQLLRGASVANISAPSRLSPSTENAATLAAVRKQVLAAIQDLLNTKINPVSGATVGEELGEIATTALAHIKELMRTAKVNNQKIEAEALPIVEQTREIFERRQADLAGAALDRERKALDNFQKKIAIVEQLLTMMDRLEPNAVVALLPNFATPRLAPMGGDE